MNGAWMSIGKLNGGGAVGGLQHGVSLSLERLAGQAPEIAFILNEQNGFVPRPRFGGHDRRLNGNGFPGCTHARQVDLERSALARFAIDPDVAFALLDDTVNRGEPEAGALGSLGSEEGLEDMRLGL